MTKKAINFANWLQFNYQPHAEQGYWYDHHNDDVKRTPVSTKKLYKKWKQKRK